ncbi:MAG TPA: hypothetical protein VFP65_25845 [Anaeromyxobacteraceae bacterium]|nr:hypothetical protein [Anaeromyxobacteraceae bacterium]
MARRSSGRVAKQGVKVTAVSTDRGPPATIVHVEVEPKKLKEDVGQLQVKGVVAEIPETSGGQVRWREERLHKVDTSARPGSGEVVERYSYGHYGPSEAKRYGVGVKVETDAGDVQAQEPRERHDVGEEGRPEKSGRTRLPPKR